jgi:hypothetical protein
MNISAEQFTRHAEHVMRKKGRIETLEALLTTHERTGAEPDSGDVKQLKERLEMERMRLAAMDRDDSPKSSWQDLHAQGENRHVGTITESVT